MIRESASDALCRVQCAGVSNPNAAEKNRPDFSEIRRLLLRGNQMVPLNRLHHAVCNLSSDQ